MAPPREIYHDHAIQHQQIAMTSPDHGTGEKAVHDPLYIPRTVYSVAFSAKLKETYCSTRAIVAKLRASDSRGVSGYRQMFFARDEIL